MSLPYTLSNVQYIKCRAVIFLAFTSSLFSMCNMFLFARTFGENGRTFGQNGQKMADDQLLFIALKMYSN